jgi:hypothetical protein
MKTVNATYNKKTGVLKVEARSEEVLPEYMKYYLIYLGLPEDTKVVYTLDKKKPKN